MEEKEISLLNNDARRGSVKLVARHAERPLFQKAKAPHDVSITDKGKDEAERLGILLRQYHLNLEGCTSSPVRRCIQTAELIAAGNRYQGKVDTAPSLGGSNLFNDDEEALDQTLETYTIEEILGKQIAGAKVPGLRGVEESLRIFMGRVLRDRSRGFEVFVSHDLFICSAVHYLTGTSYAASGNTGFLDGFFIDLRDDAALVLWNGRWYDVTGRLRSLFS